jgi:hypothetical protein
MVTPLVGFVARAANSVPVIVPIAPARGKLIVGSQLPRSQAMWIPVAVGL